MQRSGIAKSVAVAATTLILSAGFSLPAQAAETPNPIDTKSRAAVSKAFKEKWLPSTTVKAGWNGSLSTCNPGTQTADSLAKGADGINFYRGLNGLDSITLTDEQNKKAQAAALIMDANHTLTHYPTEDMACFTQLGKEGAGTSNLYLNWTTIPSMANVVEMYMDDPGSSNNIVGHRRWILNPTTTTMGFGTTNAANAIHVINGGTSASRAQPTFMPFPNAGYSPQQLEPSGRWSLSSSSTSVDFTNATVSVKDAAGTTMTVYKHRVANGYGPNTMVFEVSGVKPAAGSATSDYTVTVSNINNNGTPMTHTYTTKLFDGNDPGAVEPTPTPTPAPTPAPEPTPAPVVNPTIKSTKDILSVDSAGVLWNYNDLKSPRTRILSGFGAMATVNVTDWNSDGIADILTNAKTGELYVYKGKAEGGFSRSRIASSGWQDMEIEVAKWRKDDVYPRIFAKNKVTGDIYIYSNPTGNGLVARTKMASGWANYSLSVLDWDKDGNTDILAQSKTGTIFLFRGAGDGRFISETRKAIGSGWQNFTSVTTVRNFQGATTDGLLARNVDGVLFHYKTGTGTWETPIMVGTGWNGFNIAGN